MPRKLMTAILAVAAPVALMAAVATGDTWRYSVRRRQRASYEQERLLVTGCAALSAAAASLALVTRYLDPAVPVLWGLALAGTWTVAALSASLDLAVRRPSDLAKDR